MLGLTPITLLPARERVAASLRKAIISKQISQGEVLTLDATAQALGVSVTPVREAFQILARDSLIEVRQNKTAVVLGITRKIITDHYQLRASLEGYACILFCQKQADLTPVENCFMGAQNALNVHDSSSYANFNQSFHYEIWKGADNDKMKKLLSELWNGLSMGLETTEAEYAVKSQQEHKGILEALRERNADEAARLMYEHIDRSMSDILTHYEDVE